MTLYTKKVKEVIMKKTIIRAGGFRLYFFLFLEIMFICAFIDVVYQTVTAFSPIDVIGMLLLLYLIFILGNIFFTYIAIDNEFMNLCDFNNSTLIPQIRKRKIYLGDIKCVYIGSQKYLQDQLKDNENWKRESKRFYRQFSSHRFPGAMDTVHLAIEFMDVFVVMTTDNRITIASTKPYSAVGLKRLLGALRNKGIMIYNGSRVDTGKAKIR